MSDHQQENSAFASRNGHCGGGATAISSVVALPALGTLMWLLTHSYFALPGRYGAALIPSILLVGGFMLRNRSAAVIVMVYAALLMVFGVGLAVHIGMDY